MAPGLLKAMQETCAPECSHCHSAFATSHSSQSSAEFPRDRLRRRAGSAWPKPLGHTPWGWAGTQHRVSGHPETSTCQGEAVPGCKAQGSEEGSSPA